MPRIYSFHGGSDTSHPSLLYMDGMTGFVGVGTESPAYKLDVNGNVAIRGTLYVDAISTGTLFNGMESLLDSVGGISYEDITGTIPPSAFAPGSIPASALSSSNLVIEGEAEFESNVTIRGTLYVDAISTGTLFNGGMESVGGVSYGDVSGTIPVSAFSNVSMTNVYQIGVGTNAPICPLHVNGSNSNNVSIYASHNIAELSDARVKTDLRFINDAMSKILQLNGYTYSRIDVDGEPGGRRFAGLLAQEVMEVLPEVVHEGEGGFLSLSYGNMVSLLIEAMKDIHFENEALKAELSGTRLLVDRLAKEIGIKDLVS